MDLASHEVVLLIVCCIFAVRFLRRFTENLFAAVPFNGKATAGLTLAGILYGLLLVLWLSLSTWAADNVRTSLGIQLLFVAAGAVALGVGTACFTLLGIDAAADGVERGNKGAAIAIVGLWMAITLCTGAANIGEGEFVATTFVPMLISLAIILVVVLVFATMTRSFDTIAIERDVLTALRLAGLLFACSAMLALAAAGDWVSLSATVDDFGRQIPGLTLLTAFAVFVERWIARQNNPAQNRARLATGLTLVVYAAIAGVDIALCP